MADSNDSAGSKPPPGFLATLNAYQQQQQLASATSSASHATHALAAEGTLGTRLLSDTCGASSLEDRCVGAMLAAMFGDMLGAAVEGHSSTQIRRTFGARGVRNYVPAPHMGVEALGPRCGMYTDDTNACMALAASLVACGCLDVAHSARSFGEFGLRDTPVLRGAPQSAMAVMRALRDGRSYRETATMQFADGSYANGGAMKITPIPLAFHSASAAVLRQAVKAACLPTHVHPEAVDGANVQALGVHMLIRESPDSFDVSRWLATLVAATTTGPLRDRLRAIEPYVQRAEAEVTTAAAATDASSTSPNGDVAALASSAAATGAHGERVDPVLHWYKEWKLATGVELFQLRAVDAAATAAFMVAVSWHDPELCVMRTVNAGGDTDTTACMVGALMGALHGTGWIPVRWFEPAENGQWGRDRAIALARHLHALNLRGEDKILL